MHAVRAAVHFRQGSARASRRDACKSAAREEEDHQRSPGGSRRGVRTWVHQSVLAKVVEIVPKIEHAAVALACSASAGRSQPIHRISLHRPASI